jgi:glycosyltransferase involved in cell wall biosynthesis
MKKKVLIKGPILTRSGYGEQTRFLARALRSRSDLFDIYIHPLEWGKTSWMCENNEERQWIDSMVEKAIAHAQQNLQFDASIQVTIPNEWQPIAPINIGYTAGIESTRVAHEWLIKANDMDRVIVISEHAKRGFTETQYAATNNTTGQTMDIAIETPIDVVNYPVKTYENYTELSLNLEYDFNFLTVAQMGPRKNILNTIKWFIEEFRDEEVGLVLKSNFARNCISDREMQIAHFKAYLSSLGDHKCKIYLLHGDMSDEEMHSLYVHPKIKSFLLLTHGEGFGLPTFEAIYSGLPVVTTGWSGQLDFLVDSETGEDMFFNVAYDIQPIQQEAVWNGVLIKESMWAFPREKSVRYQMRRCYESLTGKSAENTTKRCVEYSEKVKKNFSTEKQYSEMVESVCRGLGINSEHSLSSKDAVLSF